MQSIYDEILEHFGQFGDSKKDIHEWLDLIETELDEVHELLDQSLDYTAYRGRLILIAAILITLLSEKDSV